MVKMYHPWMGRFKGLCKFAPLCPPTKIKSTALALNLALLSVVDYMTDLPQSLQH